VEPQPVVDVEPVRFGADGDDLGPGPGERLRGHPGGGAVRAVDDDLEAVEAAREGAEQVGDVVSKPSS
jgi:hypothetical protein